MDLDPIWEKRGSLKFTEILYLMLNNLANWAKAIIVLHSVLQSLKCFSIQVFPLFIFVALCV